MTIYKNWAIGAGAIALTILMAMAIILSGRQQAQALTFPNGADIDNGVFCFLDGLPVTDVFNEPGCSATPTTGALIVIKGVSGGSAVSSDFNIHVMSSGSDIAGSPQVGSNVGTIYDGLTPGTFTVSEDASSTYTPSFGGDCDASGNVTVSADATSTCIMTNTYIPPAPTTGVLEVDKVIVGGPSVNPDQFLFQVTEGAGSPGSALPFDASGTTNMSVNPDTYTVDEVASSTYTTTYANSQNGNADCDNLSVTAGATTTCTVTNTYIPPTPPSCTIVSDTNTEDATDGHAAVLVTPLNAAWTATSTATYDPSAAWVWSENPAINTDVNVTKGFTRTFNIVGTPTNASIDIAADNGFVLIVNGTTVEDASTTSNYTTSQHFDITSDLVTGSNTVEADVTNFGVSGSDGSNNPGGLIFQVNLPDNSCTSGGGGGGGNTSDLSVTKTVNDSTPTEGDQVIYTIGVNNAGPDSANGVSVTDLLPANLTYVSDDGAGAYNSTTGVWTIGTIADAATSTLHITATVGSTTSTITNTASITSDTSTDPNSGNNSGSASITPVAPGSTNVTQTIVVQPSNMQGWQIENYHTPDNGATYTDEGSATTTDGTGGYFVDGPATPPLGIGSFQDVVGTTGNDGTLMDTSAYNGLPLSDITALTYQTYVQQNMGAQATYLAINISTSGGTTTDTLFFEPVYQSGTYSLLPYATTSVPNQCGSNPDCVTLNTWQSWNAQEGGWWSNNDSAGGPPLTTLADYEKEYPSAEIATDGPSVAVQAGFGSGAWNNFLGNFDDLVVGTTEGTNATTTTYDFDPNAVSNPSNGGGGGSNPTPNTPSGGGGNSNGPIFGGGGGGGGGPIGQVLGASTSTGAISSCTQYLTSFIKLGANNDTTQVDRLQAFLDQFEGDTLPINGVYDTATYNAVKAFQQKYSSDVLTPWGENEPTGYVYLTTRREINIIYCNYTEQFPLTAAQQAVINAYKAGGAAGGNSSGITSPAAPTTPGNTNTNTNTQTPSQPENSSTNINLDEVGAVGATQSGGGFWGSIGSFFSHLFHH